MKSQLCRLMRRLRPLLIAAAIVAVVCCLAADVSACPTCKDGVAENDPQRTSMAAGFYYSILFMLSMPVIIITTFSTCAYRAVKKAELARLQSVDASPSAKSPAAC